MGNYNDYYQRYYSSISKRALKSNTNRKNSTSNSSIYTSYKEKPKGNFFLSYFNNFGTKFIIQLGTVLLLMIVLLSCKTFDNTFTREIYGLSKEVINKDYNYSVIIDKAKSFNLHELESKSILIIEKIKSIFTGGLTIQDEIKNHYVLPVSIGNVKNSESIAVLAKGVNAENVLWIKLDQESVVSSCEKGKVKKVGNDDTLGKYVVVDHGKGIETKYNNLSEVTVESGEEVEKGQTIGRIIPEANKFKTFYFELLYMGNRQNVKDYLEI